MSKLEKLIAELCPDGVEYRDLESVIISLKTGLNPRKNFILNTKDATNYYVTVREIVNGKIVFFDKTDKVNDEGLLLINNRSNLEKGDILFSGTGTVGRTAVLEDSPRNWNIKEGVYTIKPNQEIVCSKYLGYLLNSSDICNCYSKKIVGSPVCSLPMAELKQIQIPVPPLPVQSEIVRILDNFTELTAELTAELTDRKKQYEYYRDSLLTFGEEVPMVSLGDIATIIRGGNFQKKDFTESGVPCIHYGQIYTKYGLSATETITFITNDVAKKSKFANKNDIVMAVTSENVEDVCKCVVWLGEDDVAISGHTAIIKHSQNAKFLAYYFHSAMFFKDKIKLAHGTKVIEVTPFKLADIKIPLPSLVEQQRIVDILDRFDTLCNDISKGLPAEIDERQRQYEYYRDKLLTFDKLDVEV